jgi:hypothetical protein
VNAPGRSANSVRCWQTLALLAGLAGSGVTGAQEIAGDVAVQSQWFTGSLEAPSPALPKAGILALEPYAIYTNNTGAYGDGWHHYSVPNEVSSYESVTVFKYALTDRLSVEALPSVVRTSSDHASTSGFGDFPTELEYRFNDENNRTGAPSVTAALGVSLPTGRYEHLNTPLAGLGSGAYTLKGGLLFQSLFDTADHHPVRLRFYGAVFESLGTVSVQDVSVYGTTFGFRGHVAPGVAEELGVGGGYALDQRWVLALDLVGNNVAGFKLHGTQASGSSVHVTGDTSSSVSIAPAVEYNWSGNIGVIAGVEFSAAGRNTSSYVAPQIALAMAF